MKKNNSFLKKNKIYLIIGALFIIWVGFVIFVIFPSTKTLKDNYDLVQMKLINVQDNEDKLGKLSILKDNFEKVNNTGQSLETIFHKDNIVSLVNELEAIAQKTENDIVISVDENNKKILELGKNNPNNKENELLKSLPAKNYFTIKIVLIGNYNGLINFVDKLNSIKYYNSLVSFDIESKKITIENKSETDINNTSGGMSVLSTGNNEVANLTVEEKEKLVISSELDVIFYSLEKNDGTK